jgi:hypothetical protein
MQDRRRREEQGSAIDRAVETALSRLVEGLPPEEGRAVLRQVRAELGGLLSSVPPAGPDMVEEIANRARLAAAFRVSFPKGGAESGRS